MTTRVDEDKIGGKAFSEESPKIEGWALAGTEDVTCLEVLVSKAAARRHDIRFLSAQGAGSPGPTCLGPLVHACNTSRDVL